MYDKDNRMITIADYYRINRRTIANSAGFDLSLDEKSFFPEGIYIGELESVTGHKAPALIPLAQTNGICFLTHAENRDLIHKAMQSIALRLILSLPPGLCKFTLYDGTGLGENLIALAKISPQIKGEKILTEPEELKSALINKAKLDIPDIIQNFLGAKYKGKSLIEYNREAGDMARPYHFVFIADCPHTLSNEHSESIERIVKSGQKAGVFLIMSLDTSYPFNNHYGYNPMSLLNSMTIIYESKGSYYIKNLPDEKLFNKAFQLHLDAYLPGEGILKSIQDKIDRDLKNLENKKIIITSEFTENTLWKSNGSLGIDVPIGKVNVTDLQHFRLSVEDGIVGVPHHCLIGGETGFGKTTLLHNIICNTAWLYSPEDVQFILLDYKEGTDFKPYENLPHAKVLSIESEREYGVSVFKFLYNEIEQRGESFKNLEVSNIAEYNEASKEKLPRILVVIDEFQILLNGDARTIDFISKALDHIGRLGRSFGINLILSTQSLGGVNISNALSHLGLRIALTLIREIDCIHLLGNDNYAPLTITNKGEAIYNARGGLTDGNLQFKLAYLSKSMLKEFINNLKKEVIKRYHTDRPFKRFIYDGKLKAYIKNNPDLANTALSIDNKKCKVYIGEPAALVEKHTHYTLSRKNESNVLIIGQDTASAASIIYHSLNQIIQQSSAGSRFYVCEKINVDNASYGKINPLTKKYPKLKIVESDSEIETVITDIFNELEKRKAANKAGNRMVLVLSDIYNARILRKSGYNPAPATQKLVAILKDGSSFGIHTMVYANSYANFDAILDAHQLLKEFEVKIELKGGDGYRIFSFDAQKATPANDNIANILIPQQNEIQKFKVYSL
jgi:hypothetical protein